jgi:lipopolysaccharide transport system ATP-binding protein
MARAIEVEGLGKRYSLGEDFGQRYLTIREAIASRLRRASRNGTPEVWALREVDFALEGGEVLGIVGRNGAGKTTLLRILSRITEPTTGVARTRGRVGTLLDVGTGFHPELNGRENIYLNGAILGMSTREITRCFDEIVEFAGVERFLDTPLKRYSAGMQLRLAFAVAAHLEPEIIVVDEVLAVGDVAFQQKCLGKMGDVAREGRTVLFVSHSMGAIESLCERVLWLEQGRLMADGAPREVISQYLGSVAQSKTSQTWDEPLEAPGNEWVRLRSASVYPEGGSPSDAITVHTPIVIDFEYDNLQAETYLNLSLHLYSAEGVLVLNAVPVNEPKWFGRAYPRGRFRDRCRIPANLLNNGAYRVELLVVRDHSDVLYRDSSVLEFDVQDVVQTTGTFEGEWSGVIRPALQWQTEHIG